MMPAIHMNFFEERSAVRARSSCSRINCPCDTPIRAAVCSIHNASFFVGRKVIVLPIWQKCKHDTSNGQWIRELNLIRLAAIDRERHVVEQRIEGILAAPACLSSGKFQRSEIDVSGQLGATEVQSNLKSSEEFRLPFFAAEAFVNGAIPKSIGQRSNNECQHTLDPDWYGEV